MKVTLYTIPDCPFSKQAKDFLASKGIEFVEKDVQSNKDNLSEMLSQSNNFAGVPFCVVEKDSGQKDVLKGFTQSDYEAVLMPKTALESAPAVVPVPVAAPVVDAPAVVPAPVAAPVADAPAVVPAPSAAFTMPPVPEVPAMPSMTSAPSMPVSTMPAPSMPAAESFGTPAMPMTPPAAPSMPMTPPAAVEPLADPQDELSGLLKDLESKVTPAMPMTPPPAAPSMATPAMPDFPKVQ